MRSLFKTIGALVPILISITTSLSASAESSFLRDVAPILLKRCAGCHGERVHLGGYRVDTFQSLLLKGASGEKSIVPGKPDDSRLFQLITAKVEAVRMPKSDDQLAPEQIAIIRAWIAGGAKFDGASVSVPIKSLLGPRRHPAAPVVYRTASPIMALAFLPDGREIAVGGYNEITIWNAASGKLIRRIEHLPQRIQSLSLSKDGKTALIGGGTPGEYGEASLIDLASGKRTKVLDTFNDIVLSAVFSPDGRHIAVGGADMSVRLYDFESGKRVWMSSIHSDWVTAVSFSPDGHFVASASKDMTVKVFEAADGSLFTTYNGHNRQIGKYMGQNPVYSLIFEPGAQFACSAGGGNWIQLWSPIEAKADSGDAGDMEERFAKQGHTRYIEHGFKKGVFALNVRGNNIFAASADGILKEFDLSSQKLIRTYPGKSDWLFSLSVDDSGDQIAAGSYSGEIRIWDTKSGRLIIMFFAQPGRSQRQVPGISTLTRQN